MRKRNKCKVYLGEADLSTGYPQVSEGNPPATLILYHKFPRVSRKILKKFKYFAATFVPFYKVSKHLLSLKRTKKPDTMRPSGHVSGLATTCPVPIGTDD